MSERGRVSLVDVLDRVLDKGIVIDAWARVAFVGIDLVSFESWVVVASIETYLRHAESLGLTPFVTPPLHSVEGRPFPTGLS